MQGTVLALFGAALAAGLAELLLPTEQEGSAKVFRLLISLVVLLLILTPFLGFLRESESLFSGEITLEEEPSADFEQIFSDTVQAQGKAEFETGLYELLAREYGIPQENATVLTRFDADGMLAGVTVYLSGTGILHDPAQLEKELSKTLNCTVEVR